MEIVVATHNQGKLSEIKHIFKDLPITILSLKDLGISIDTVEDQISFEGNAIKKAMETMKLTNKITLADDSGLEVEALGGQPGIYSARFAGPNANDEQNNIKLLKMLENTPIKKRKAQFRCCMALVYPSGKIITTNGICHGKIGFKPVGNNGFGYDPLFIVDGLEKTFAELPDGQKNLISHRAIALKELRNVLFEELNS